MNIIAYIIYNKLFHYSGNKSDDGTKIDVNIDENGDIIVFDENIDLHIDFASASLITEGNLFSVRNNCLIASITNGVVKSNKKAWILSMM